MPLFLSATTEPFYLQLEYVKDALGNTIGVSIPIDIWTKILKRYTTIFANEDITDTPSHNAPITQQANEF